MKVLVTGGLGFIGSNFVRYVLREYRDIEVINLDAVKYGSNPDNLKDIEGDERYTFIRGDIADYELVKDLVKGVDAIVNFAAETHVDRSISNPESFLRSNVVGVHSLLEAIRKHNSNAVFVHISTDEVYGDIMEGSFKEDDRLKPSSPYSASKAAGDLFVLSYVRTYGIDARITRCTNNYGPYQFPEKLIPKTIIRTLMGLKVPVYGTGQNVRDWLYVEDHCRAIDLVVQEGEKGEIYNISSGEERTNLEVVKTILNMLGRDESMIEFVEDRPGHDVRYSLDSSKIRGELGWRPRVSFDEGIEETVRWYRENTWWWEKLVDERVLHPTPWKLKW
ncbi:dTDP-glucose 4,6-dehydratase [Geoglobus acetivorans]|uniref:dTDP-glucose 4,6-dehydratase n=1 Tax=Geoglobus acetivorans TaxID=565033 RepID=A0ABZ3H2W3_GEOAI|nr:dTDP-glucose 4,6-dehydratase [Geoglobus acetivorans]